VTRQVLNWLPAPLQTERHPANLKKKENRNDNEKRAGDGGRHEAQQGWSNMSWRIILFVPLALFETALLMVTILIIPVSSKTAKRITDWAINTLPNPKWYKGKNL